MTESELYKNLGSLTKSKDRWEENIPLVASLLSLESTKIKAKALWLLGEMGLKFPNAVKDSVPAIAAFCDREEPLLRERAVNALGRIGRGCYSSVEPYWDSLFRFAHDEEASVRLAFIWASENIATNTPDPGAVSARRSTAGTQYRPGILWRPAAHPSVLRTAPLRGEQPSQSTVSAATTRLPPPSPRWRSLIASSASCLESPFS